MLPTVRKLLISCRKGHPFTQQNTYNTNGGKRICITCQKVRYLKNSSNKVTKRYYKTSWDFLTGNGQKSKKGRKKISIMESPQGCTILVEESND
jgi:hypothetical protein